MVLVPPDSPAVTTLGLLLYRFGGRSYGIREGLAVALSFLFFQLWFIRFEPAHQMLSVDPHLSVTGGRVLGVICCATFAAWIYMSRLLRGTGLITSLLVLVVVGVALEALARAGIPDRMRHAAVARLVSRFALLRHAARPLQGGGSAPRVLFIGVDGLEWRVVEAMVGAGKLPAIERVLRDSRFYQLDNLRMRESPEIWTTMIRVLRRRRTASRVFCAGHS